MWWKCPPICSNSPNFAPYPLLQVKRYVVSSCHLYSLTGGSFEDPSNQFSFVCLFVYTSTFPLSSLVCLFAYISTFPHPLPLTGWEMSIFRPVLQQNKIMQYHFDPEPSSFQYFGKSNIKKNVRDIYSTTPPKALFP